VVGIEVWAIVIAFWLGPAIAMILARSGRVAAAIGAVWASLILAAWVWLYAFALPARVAEGSDLGPTVFAVVAVVTLPALGTLLVASIIKVIVVSRRRTTPPSPSA
jgi:hypothetical protein